MRGGDACTGLDYTVQDDLDDVDSKEMSTTKKQVQAAQNRNLIEYFARLGEIGKEDDSINLDYVDSLLTNGASIGCSDKYGQTVLHEVRRYPQGGHWLPSESITIHKNIGKGVFFNNGKGTALTSV